MTRAVTSIQDLQRYIDAYRESGKTIGFVPTMGALHEGHISLVKAAQQHCDVTVVSIFVNPAQFGPNEDFDRYPRTLEADAQRLEAENVELIFSPSVETLYPPGDTKPTQVHVPVLSTLYCGASRPVFFDGICTVVSRLFNIVTPDAAFFGEKDFQQVAIIRKMVHDLFMPISIIGCPIIREDSGLAMSSRNRYLSEENKVRAATIFNALHTAKERFKNGETNCDKLLDTVRSTLDPAIEIDYCVLVDATTLQETRTATSNSRILFAGNLSGTRLIDNIGL
jgi:pantoate--beta-alanine ligase